MLAASLLLAATTVACGKASGGADTSGGQAASGSLQIAENDAGFEPRAVTVAAGRPLRLTFTNKGRVIHNLRIAGPDGRFNTADDTVLGDPVVQPGQSASTEWTPPSQPGALAFRCDAHPTHTGTVTVR